MGATQTRMVRDIVKSTKTYQSLNKIMKDIVSKRNNIVQIENGLNVARNIGYKKWENISNSSWANKLIIAEIILNESKDNEC